MYLHWHRSDLRIGDNRGLAATPDGTETLPVFVFDPAVLAHAGPPRVRFLLDAIDELRNSYRDRDCTLLLAHGPPERVLPALALTLDASGVTWCSDYSGLSSERATAVQEALAEESVDSEAVADAVHHEPGEITTGDGNPYKVFTYFSRKWHDREKRDPIPVPDAASLTTLDAENRERADAVLDDRDETDRLDSVPTVADLGFDEPEATIPDAGTNAARTLLDSFCAADIYRYDERRDYPADDCTSRLSPHLAFGTIGIREVYAATEEATEDAPDETARESVAEFQDQLAWREFYTQVLWDRPDVVTENYKTYENDIEWHDDETALQAWKDGRTGYPIVDAGMRQLRTEAFMHNRVRMIVASFLTKDLLLDWREGYRWFREKLVDHETANDNGGWQWAASTGTDAQPYFRIFNPTTQGERYDPDAEYIQRYVPELADVPAETIHAWPELESTARERHAPEYPEPIVDHSERREQAIAMFERARGDE
jgi:deoxyribodipyrimidine photo-lyase